MAVQQIVPPPAWNKVVILPVSGDARHAEQVTAILKEQLQDRIELELVVHPSNPQSEPRDPDAPMPLSEAQKLAEDLRVDAFLQGKILTDTRGKRPDAVLSLDLVEAKSGRIVASTHRPSGELLATTEEECVASATERAAKDMVKAIERLHLQKPTPKAGKKKR